MTSELSTNVVKINLKEIIDNILDREYWEKSWCIFDYNNVTIVIKLSSIEVSDNMAIIKIFVTDNLNEGWGRVRSNYVGFNIDKPVYTSFKKSVMGTIHRLIESHERLAAEYTEKYKMLLAEEDAFRKSSINKLKEELDELGIDHEGVREAYINENYEIINLTSDYVSTFVQAYMLPVHNQVDAMVEFIGG